MTNIDDVLVDGVYRIANHRCKLSGYQTRINREDVRIVLESAAQLVELHQQNIEKENSNGNTQTQVR